MAKYSVKHTCGHISEVALFGPSKDREYRLDRMRENVCLNCENAANAERNAEAGLPALTGTPKQIAWAESIRAAAMARRELSPETLAQTKASWWIDQRYSL